MQTRRAFTLIELLVVVAIIGILAALLLPAINLARASAKQVTCMSTVRQVGFGMHGYAEDWGGRVPPVDDNGWGFRVHWMAVILPYVDGGKRHNVLKGCPNYKPVSIHHGYAMNTKLDRPDSYGTNSRNPDGSPKWGSFYTEVWFGRLSYASNRLLISERDRDNNIGDEQTITYTRHNGRANALFCDLHVETVTKASVKFALRDPLKYK